MKKDLPGPDHWFSMDPNELNNLVSSVREAENMFGSGRIGPTASEALGRRDFRLSCAASRDISKGEFIEENDIILQRPGDGILPTHQNILVGLKANRDIKKGCKFDMGDFNG